MVDPPADSARGINIQFVLGDMEDFLAGLPSRLSENAANSLLFRVANSVISVCVLVNEVATEAIPRDDEFNGGD